MANCETPLTVIGPSVQAPHEIDGADLAACDPDNYTPLTGQEMVECIDPRRKRGVASQGVAVQTPGGEAGRAQDDALIDTVLHGEFVSMQDKLQAPADGTVVGAAHADICKFLGARTPILGRYATLGLLSLDPKLAELHSTEAWLRTGGWLGWYAHRLGIELPDMTTAANALARAAVEHREEAALTQPTQEEVLDLVNRRHPDHHNVFRMEGAVTADVYVTNHTLQGLDRDRLSAQGGQFFHDNLGAMVDLGLATAERLGLSGADRALFVAAPIMRTSSTIATLDALREAQDGQPLRHYQRAVTEPIPQLPRLYGTK